MNFIQKIRNHFYLMIHGRKCNQCGKKYLPNPWYAKTHIGWTHYPNTFHCGFCVYDMDSYETSQWDQIELDLIERDREINPKIE